MPAFYVPWLHMHQPLVWSNDKLVGNIEKMLESPDQKESWEAKLMLRSYKNPAKFVESLRKSGYQAKIMLDFSGLLLENLEKIKSVLKEIDVNGEKIGDIIKLYKDVMKNYPNSIEFAGTAYSHCYFPVTPKRDWVYQVETWREVFEKLFGKNQLKRIKGFWLPEMGIPGKNDIPQLIRILRDQGYEWMILPIESLKDEKKLSFEERVVKTSQPHLLKVGGEEIKVVFRVRYDFIDQQAGCDANGVYQKCLLASSIFSKVSDKPALVVPASDGENGNVMMNEFFPSTFDRFFRENIDDKVSSLTITEFLNEYYQEIKSEVELEDSGSSWLGSHRNWEEGDERRKINQEISKFSERFENIKAEAKKIPDDKEISQKLNELKRFLLISETSCYTYWGSDFWFKQAWLVFEKLESLIKKVEHLLDRKLYLKKTK